MRPLTVVVNKEGPGVKKAENHNPNLKYEQ